MTNSFGLVGNDQQLNIEKPIQFHTVEKTPRLKLQSIFDHLHKIKFSDSTTFVKLIGGTELENCFN